jgi:hypothetical protein
VWSSASTPRRCTAQSRASDWCRCKCFDKPRTASKPAHVLSPTRGAEEFLSSPGNVLPVRRDCRRKRDLRLTRFHPRIERALGAFAKIGSGYFVTTITLPEVSVFELTVNPPVSSAFGDRLRSGDLWQEDSWDIQAPSSASHEFATGARSKAGRVHPSRSSS